MSHESRIMPFAKRPRRPKPKPPARPEWLSGEAAELWSSLASELARHGWLDALSAFGFGVICELSQHFRRLSSEIARLGTEEATAKGIYREWLDVRPSCARGRTRTS